MLFALSRFGFHLKMRFMPAMAQSYFRLGYRPLGYSDFTNLRGQPMRSEAIAYGKQLGADVILYSLWALGPETHAVMDSSGGVATSNTYGSFNYGQNGYGTVNGTTTTYLPPTFHQEVVPETFVREEHFISFLSRN
jgi:hypothetical protein